MNQGNKANVYGNIICASVGFLIVFLTSIFVGKNYYDNKINGLIQDATILKDYHYSSWGKFPGTISADYTYTLTPYTIQSSNTSFAINTKPLEPINFNYSFKYKEVSFGQGNQGFIRYKDSWKLTPSKNIGNENITTINLGAEKVYGYQYYSTISRRFTIMFNNLLKNMKKILIPFYSITLHEFYIKNQNNVFNNIFKQAEIDANLMDQIYNHDLYGWKDPKTFEIWVKLCNSQDRAFLEQYQTIRDVFGLQIFELQRLIGQKSLLNILTTALNGTLKAKVEDLKQTQYQFCEPFCNDDQLMAFQFTSGLLTKDSIFNSVNIDKKTNQIITIIQNQIQLNTFCASQANRVCVQGANAYTFFKQQLLGNFSVNNEVFENKQNLKMIEALLNIPDPSGNYYYAQSMIEYMQYLHNKVFTPLNEETSEPDAKAFDYLFNNYLYLNQTINHVRQILTIQLHARAFKNIIDQQSLKCSAFYTGPYQRFATLCQNQSFNLQNIDALKTYVKAYFFQGRLQFLSQTNMKSEQASNFFKLDKANSLFAQKIDLIRSSFSKSFGCKQTYCTIQELLAKQWSGSTQILTNLPSQFFPQTSVSIIEWDVNNRLKGLQPQFYKIMKQKLQQQQANKLLSLQKDATQSILHPLTILNYKIKAESGDDFSKKLLNYMQKLVIDMYFKGPFITKSLNEALFGLKGQGIKEKGEMSLLQGGASWIQESVSLIDTQYNGDRFNKINTGIYDRQKLRKMIEYNEKSEIGTYYKVFQTQYQQVQSFIKSQNYIYGTNILGFHPDISSSQSLSCYFNLADQGIILTPSISKYQYNGIEAIKYNIKSIDQSTNIGFTHQNQRFIKISPQSNFIIDPITGITLYFAINYQVKTKNSYLQYYFSSEIPSIKLYDAKIEYTRKNFLDIQNIIKQKENLFTFYIVAIVLAVVCMIFIIVGTIMYRIKSKVKKSILKDTLITNDSSSSIHI